MRFRFVPPFRLALLATTAALGASSQAVVNGTSNLDTTFGFVGQVNGASGVAVGPRAFLTAGHVLGGGVTSGTFALGTGGTYTITNSVAAPDILITDPNSPRVGQMTHVDLTLVFVSQNLPGFYNIGTSFSAATPITMVGYGGGGGVSGNFYTPTGADGSRRSGTNSINGRGDFYIAPGTTGVAGTGGGPNLQSYLVNNGNAALTGGDSGGGWFQGTTLIGLNDYVFNATDNTTRLPNYGFAAANGGTPYFGSGAIDLTDVRLRTFLAQAANPVPEPATLAALGLGALAMLRRRKKA